MRHHLRACIALLAAGSALHCTRPRPTPSVVASTPAASAGCAARPTLRLDSLAPARYARLSRTDTLRVLVHYCMPRYEPDQWFVIMVFGTGAPGVTRGAIRMTPHEPTLTSASGVVTVVQPMADIWSDPGIHWPLQVYVKLNRRNLSPGHLRSDDLVTLGPFEYYAVTMNR